MFKKYPLATIPIRNGILGGVLGMALLISLFFLHRHPFLIPPVLDFRIILFGVLIYFSLNEFRIYYRDGFLSFWEGMIMSLLLTIAFAIFSFIVIWIFGEIRPDFVSSYVSLSLEQMKSYTPDAIKQLGQERYDLTMIALASTKAVDLATRFFVQSFILSFFISVIISLVLRRQPQL